LSTLKGRGGAADWIDKAMRRAMSMLRKLRTGPRASLRSEAGIALPTVLMASVLAMGFGSVAAVATINAQSGSVRDQDTKAAIAAADAGAQRALYSYNKTATSTSLPCLVPGAGGALVPGAALGDGWCPTVTGAVASASYSYRVRPIIASGAIDRVEVVSTGTSDAVSRRIDVVANTASGQVFSHWSVIGDQYVSLDSNAGISSSTASNGDVSLDSTSQICGDIQYGVGHTVNFGGSGSQCSGYTQTAGSVSLPPVNQGDVVTSNSNGRFFTQDIRSSSAVTYDATTRTLILGTNTSLTLGGANYSLCKLRMASNTAIYIAAGANVKIYFDSPENCHQPSGVVQMDLVSNSNILTTGSSPASAAFLFVGSDTLATSAVLSSNTTVGCNFEILLYGPRTDITLTSNTSICGGVAGKSIHMNSNAHVSPHPDATNFTLPVPTHFTLSKYVECGPATSSVPNVDC